MPFIAAHDGTRLFYNDWGSGPPVVLIHGWPLNSDMWSDQATFLAENGFRVIVYDRRGFGRSDQPWNGYDYDTLASDLAAIVDGLDLNGVSLVGFSMGGGEVARYLGMVGGARVSRAALISAVTPYLLQTSDNPSGVPQSTFDEILEGLKQDRPHFLATFAKTFYGSGMLTSKVSQETLQWSLTMAMQGSLRATIECAKAFATTDFRRDLARIETPTLVLHGTSDETVPIDSSARIAAPMIARAQLVEYDGEPHGLHATAKDRLNADLLRFLR